MRDPRLLMTVQPPDPKSRPPLFGNYPPSARPAAAFPSTTSTIPNESLTRPLKSNPQFQPPCGRAVQAQDCRTFRGCHQHPLLGTIWRWRTQNQERARTRLHADARASVFRLFQLAFKVGCNAVEVRDLDFNNSIRLPPRAPIFHQHQKSHCFRLPVPVLGCVYVRGV